MSKPLSSLHPIARRAVSLAKQCGFAVIVETQDGERHQVGPAGRPGRSLVIALGAGQNDRFAQPVEVAPDATL